VLCNAMRDVEHSSNVLQAMSEHAVSGKNLTVTTVTAPRGEAGGASRSETQWCLWLWLRARKSRSRDHRSLRAGAVALPPSSRGRHVMLAPKLSSGQGQVIREMRAGFWLRKVSPGSYGVEVALARLSGRLIRAGPPRKTRIFQTKILYQNCSSHLSLSNSPSAMSD
jgi:hypothetical protein